MSDHVPLDNHIKQQLGDYAPDVPSHIWSQIVARREQQKPKGLWLRFSNIRNWMLVAALLLVAGGTAYWMSRPTTLSENDTIQNDNANELIARNTPTTSSQNNINTPVASSTADNKTDINTTTIDNNSNNNNPVTNNTITQPNSSSIVPSNSTINGSLHFAPSTNNHFVNRRDKPVYLPIKKQASSTIKNGMDSQTASGIDDPAVTEDGLTSRSTINNIAPYQLFKLQGPASTLFNGKQGTAELRNKLLSGIYLPDCPSIEDNAAGNKKYIDVYAGPDLGLRSFGSFAGDTATSNYLRKRKESARFASAFSAGVRYTKVFNNGMSLRSGINYSQINEKFEYINPRDIRYVLVITPRDIISNGNVVTVYDTVRYTQTGTRQKTTHNKYRSIDIPLQLGYEFGNGRLHTNISAGAIVNVYSWHKGDVLDSAYQPVSITTGKSSSAYGFKTNIGVGFLGSVSVYYKLTNNMHLLAEPYFRYNLQPMTRDNINITQKYSTLGLRLGVRWDLK